MFLISTVVHVTNDMFLVEMVGVFVFQREAACVVGDMGMSCWLTLNWPLEGRQRNEATKIKNKVHSKGIEQKVPSPHFFVLRTSHTSLPLDGTLAIGNDIVKRAIIILIFFVFTYGT